MLDRYWSGPVEQIAYDAPVPVVEVNRERFFLGGAANVALNLKHLGCQVTVFGIVGDDMAGEKIRALLEDAGIQANLVVDADSETIMKCRVLSQNHQMMRLDFESGFSDHAFQQLSKQLLAPRVQTDCIVLSDYAKGSLASHLLPDLIAGIKGNTKIIVDPKLADLTVYRGADILTPNLKEFVCAGGDVSSESALVTSAEAMRKNLGLDALLLTRGGDGMSLFDQTGHTHVPAHSPDVVDVTGAGDTVIAVLSALVSAGYTLKEAMLTANHAASIVVGRVGASSVTAEDLVSG